MDGGAAPSASIALGRCDEMRAEVFLRLRVASAGDDALCTVSGTLTGPQRGRDTTLPATARLEPTATRGIARAILTEPAYWTPGLPNLYQLRATVRPEESPPHALHRLMGLRRLGVRGRSLWLDGHRWVPRAVRVEGVAGIDACKPAALAALITEPDEATLARADEIGVAVLALVSATATDPATIADRIATWSAHPSAVLAILPPHIPAAAAAEIASASRPLRDTLLLAATVTGADPPPASIPPGIDALVVSLNEDATPHDAWRSAAVPVLAWRREPTTPDSGRAPCDALQATLAAWGTGGNRDTLAWDWAGYIAG